MPSPDIYKLIVDHLWSLLEARSQAGQWASIVHVNNRIKVGEKFDPFKQIINSSDRPLAVLIMAATSDSATTLFPTFGNVAGTCPARISEVRCDAMLGLTHEDFRREPIDTLVRETQAAWEDAHASLVSLLKAAIPYCGVRQWGPITFDTDWTGKRPPLVPITDWDQTPSPTTIVKSPLIIRFSSSGPPLT